MILMNVNIVPIYCIERISSSCLVLIASQLKVFGHCIVHFGVHCFAHFSFHCSSYHQDATNVENNEEENHSKYLVPLRLVSWLFFASYEWISLVNNSRKTENTDVLITWHIQKTKNPMLAWFHHIILFWYLWLIKYKWYWIFNISCHAF